MTEQTEILTSDRVVLWFNTPHSEPFMHLNGVGIFRLMQRKFDRDTVILEFLLPKGLEIIQKLDVYTIIDVRHIPFGVMDDPLNGYTLCYIKHMVPKDQWINRIARPDYDNEAVKIYLHADCQIDFVL